MAIEHNIKRGDLALIALLYCRRSCHVKTTIIVTDCLRGSHNFSERGNTSIICGFSIVFCNRGDEHQIN
jgi:hypothetical protein